MTVISGGSHPLDEREIAELRAEVERLTSELAEARFSARQWRWEAERVRLQFAAETKRVGVLAQRLVDAGHSPEGFHARAGHRSSCADCNALREALVDIRPEVADVEPRIAAGQAVLDLADAARNDLQSAIRRGYSCLEPLLEAVRARRSLAAVGGEIDESSVNAQLDPVREAAEAVRLDAQLADVERRTAAGNRVFAAAVALADIEKTRTPATEDSSIWLEARKAAAAPVENNHRRTVNLRKAFTALAIGALLATGGVACGDPAASGVEVEDCDAEDYANREADCGFTDADRKKKTTPTKRKR